MHSTLFFCIKFYIFKINFGNIFGIDFEKKKSLKIVDVFQVSVAEKLLNNIFGIKYFLGMPSKTRLQNFIASFIIIFFIAAAVHCDLSCDFV